MEVIAICATKGRHFHLERTLGFFLNQDCSLHHSLIIYNNSDVKQELDVNTIKNLPFNKSVYLVNSSQNLIKKTPYSSLGEIYNDILLLKPFFTEDSIICHFDDDDIYLPNHISEGVKGLLKGNKKAYKPKRSYYISPENSSPVLVENVLEPSIFVKYEHLSKYGYGNKNTSLHHQWLQPLIENKEIFIDEEGVPTFIYDWSGIIPIWKTSGGGDTDETFKNYDKFSKEHGDKKISKMPDSQLTKYYYNLI